MTSLRLGLRVLAWSAIVLPAVEVIARQLTRARPLPFFPEPPLLLAALPLAGLLGLRLLDGWAPRWRTASVFAALFASGLAMQLQLGARLQSDGFYYFA